MANKNAQSKRELYCRRMRQIHDASLIAEANSQNWVAFLARYDDVASIVDTFKVSHFKIIQEATSDFDKEDQVRAQFDQLHYAVNTKYYVLTGASEPGGSGEDGSRSTLSKVKLSKITLPQFLCDIALWPSLFSLYNTSIHNNTQLSAIEKGDC